MDFSCEFKCLYYEKYGRITANHMLWPQGCVAQILFLLDNVLKQNQTSKILKTFRSVCKCQSSGIWIFRHTNI